MIIYVFYEICRKLLVHRVPDDREVEKRHVNTVWAITLSRKDNVLKELGHQEVAPQSGLDFNWGKVLHCFRRSYYLRTIIPIKSLVYNKCNQPFGGVTRKLYILISKLSSLINLCKVNISFVTRKRLKVKAFSQSSIYGKQVHLIHG